MRREPHEKKRIRRDLIRACRVFIAGRAYSDILSALTRNSDRNFRGNKTSARYTNCAKVLGTYAAGARFRGPQISGSAARSRISDNSGVPPLSCRSLQQLTGPPQALFLLDRAILPNRPRCIFRLSSVTSRNLAVPPPLPLPRGASYISCTVHITVLPRGRCGRCAKKAVFKQWENSRTKSVAEMHPRNRGSER